MVAQKECWAKAVARKLADIFNAGAYKANRKPYIVHYMTMMQVAFEGMPITPGMYDEAQRKLPQIRNYLEGLVGFEVVLVTKEPFGITDAAAKAKRHPPPATQGDLLDDLLRTTAPASCIAGRGSAAAKAFGLYIATGMNDPIHMAWCKLRATRAGNAVAAVDELLADSKVKGLVDGEAAMTIRARALPEPPMDAEAILSRLRKMLPAGEQAA